MFTLHAFIPADTIFHSLEIVERELTGLLQRVSPPPLEKSFDTLPFSNEPRLLYRWATWSFSVICEKGQRVAADAEVVERETGCSFSPGLPVNRIRIVFGQDKGCLFTNHIIWITDWLKEIPEAVVYDEASKSLC